MTVQDGRLSFALVAPDAETWEAFVAQHPQGSLLQRPGWGELKSQFGWDVQRLAIMSPDGLRAGAQLLFKRRFGLAAAYVPRGPLLSGDAEIDRALLRAMRALSTRSRAIFLRLEPNMLEQAAGAQQLHSALLLAGFQPTPPLQPRSTVHLDLGPTPEKLLSAMSKGHRADIRRAAREGVTVRVGEGEADLDAFYAIMQSTSARAQFGIHSRDYYAAVLRIFGRSADALLLLADWRGETVATALMCADAHAGLYLYSGSTPDGLKSGAQHAIQWQALQWARERGCTRYDFWGIPDAIGQALTVADPDERLRLEEQAKADALYGVYRFKKGFGGSVVRFLPAYDQVYVPPLYSLWQRRIV
ncbi:aminoacyltransferase [Chloroflexia bacterium SDU3-3]|nr:aminoacyltransferase [Chloroflexia bacterium SDU3-3]